jgi:drug/metabolite transporter (DMT)-like permease
VTGRPNASLGPVAGMVLATALWGATFVVIRDSLQTLSPATLVLTRFAIAAVLLGVAARAGRRPFGADVLQAGLVTGALGAGGYAFQAIGLTATQAGTSAFLTCAGTLLAAPFAWLALRERPSGTLAAGLVIALAGSALLSLRGGWRVGVGEAWTLLGAGLYAWQIVAVGRWGKTVDAAALAAVQAATCALVALPFAAEARAELAALDGVGWARLGYLAVAGSAVAPWLQIRAQRTLPAGRVGLLFALEPVFALAFALGIGGERFVARWWLGAALILLAVVCVEWRAARRPAGSRTASGAGASG